MPIASNFCALTIDDGFASCLGKIDVSGFDYWSTLGGYNKEAADLNVPPTELEILNSRILAMKLFWQLSGIESASAAVNFASTSLAIDNPEITPAKESRARVCGLSTYSEFDPPASTSDGRLSASIALNSPQRMYDGVTTDEDNFIGYGFANLIELRFSVGGRATLVLSSMENVDISGFSDEAAYVILGGAEFVCKVSALDTAGATSTLDAENLSVSSDYTVGGDTSSASHLLSNLVFYTF